MVLLDKANHLAFFSLITLQHASLARACQRGSVCTTKAAGTDPHVGL